MPSQIHAIPPNAKVLGVDATSKTNTLKSLSKLLINLIFKASKA
jgi:hypothetical protein